MTSTQHLDLAGSAKRGAGYSVVASVIASFLQLALVAVLARILLPNDFAIAAIATIAVGLLSYYADFGLSGAIIHFRDVDAEDLSTLYWFNLILGLVLALVVAIAAPSIATFYGNAKLALVLQILCPAIFVSSAGSQYRALHKKHLKFGILASAAIASSSVSFVATALCARAGLGVYSISWGALAASIAGALVVIGYGLREYRPGFVFRLGSAARLLRYGGYQVAERTLDFANMQSDTLIIGKFAGMIALGYYAPVKMLCLKPITLINPILTNISFPVMSAVQDDLVRVSRIYLLQVQTIASLTLPLYFFMMATAEPLIIFFLGPRWEAAIPITRLLAGWGALVSIGNPVGSLLLATGQVRRSFFWNVFTSMLIPLCIFASAPYGMVRVAQVLLLIYSVLSILGWRFLIWPASRTGFHAYLKSIARPLFPALLAACAVLPIMFTAITPLPKLFTAGGVYGAVYIGLSWAFNRETCRLLLDTARHTICRKVISQ